MPFAAMSALRRAIVSSRPYALLTRMTPSSLARVATCCEAVAGAALTGTRNAGDTEITASVDAKSVVAKGFMAFSFGWGLFLDLASVGFVQYETFDSVDRRFPGFCFQHAIGVGVPGAPARLNSIGAEIDVSGVIFATHLRCQKAHDVHACEATVCSN